MSRRCGRPAKTELLFIPRAAIEPVIAGNQAALAFVASYVAISSAGGFVAQLFDLRGKLNKAELEEYVRSVGVKRVAAGKEILKQDGRDDRRLYVVRQGEVRIVRHEEGHDYTLATLGEGEIFGEKACLMRQEQMASVVATTDTRLLVIPERTVHFILERNPKLREVLDERIRYGDRELQRQKRLEQRRKLPLMLDLQTKPEFGEKVIKRFALVEQAEEMDCGAACLAMVCRHYSIPMTLGKLRELANVTTQGATLDSLARAGESLGFTARGVQCTFDSLRGFDLPFIVHWEGYHYVVVYGVSKEYVWVADPALGFRKMTVEDFERGWSGTCLLFTGRTESRADVGCALAVDTLCRLPQAVQEDSRPPVSCDVRDSGARRDSAADHPEHSRRGDRASERQPAASADRRLDHRQCVLAIDVVYSRVSREFHGAQHGLRDDVAVLQAHACRCRSRSSPNGRPATSSRASRRTRRSARFSPNPR